jgi:cellulose synthase/poly-beta-1,6-N-acetylglucosamine synthase-like glycosyltransferase
MFIITSIYFLMLFLIFWSYCGYLIVLIVVSSQSQPSGSDNRSSLMTPRIAVLIPCYNEEHYVPKKIENLKTLAYDQNKMDVFFLNGCSTDNTGLKIAELISDMENWHLIETNCKGKIGQINNGLSKISPDVDIIVNTDMDAILSSDVLSEIVRTFNSNDRIAVVGANILPHNAIALEEKYWYLQTLLRLMESDVYISSIVVAPCYAYRPWLVKEFPADCVADDIYIAFKANTDGYLTKCIEFAKGIEVRTPKTFQDFFQHKYRKGNAYLIELLRFLYQLPQMTGWWKVMYATKFLQLVIMPWIIPFFLAATVSLSLNGWGYFQLALLGVSFLFISYLVTIFLLFRCQKRYPINGHSKKPFSPLLVLINNIILMLVSFRYPFYRQTSRYQRLSEKQEKSC